MSQPGVARAPRAGSDPEGLDELTRARAMRGDRGAFRQLVERYQRPVFALLGRILHGGGRESAVEDLAQETFVRVFNGLPKFGVDGRLNLSAWIFTIAARLAIDELRHKSDRPSRLEEAAEVASSSRTDEQMERRGLATAIERAVDALAPEYRAAFLLREVHGLSYEDIAQALEIDIGTVKSRLSRARAALKAALSGIHHEE